MNAIKNTDFDYDSYLKRTRKALGNANRTSAIFKKQIIIITTSLKEGKEIPYDSIQWISAKRYAYRKGKYISQEAFEALEQLIPVLGFDWKEGRPRKRVLFKDRLEELKTLLTASEIICSGDRCYIWLSRQRKLYHDRHNEPYPKAQEKALDELIPLLGYDWKDKRPSKKIRFKKHVQEIKRLLEAGATIDRLHPEYRWMYRQEKLYHSQELPKDQEQLLDTLIPLLGYDWKRERTHGKPIPFHDKIEEIRNVLTSGQSIEIGDRYYSWLSKQRVLYKDELLGKKPYPKDQKEALDALIPMLGYDWKLYLSEHNTVRSQQV